MYLRVKNDSECSDGDTHTCTHTYTYIYIYMYTYTIDKYPCGDHKLVSNVWNCNVPPRLRKIPREYLYLCQVNGRRSIFFHAWTGAPHHVLMRSLGYNVVGRTICRLLDSEGEVGHQMWSKSLIDLSQLGENLKLSQVALCFFNVSVPRGRGEIHTWIIEWLVTWCDLCSTTRQRVGTDHGKAASWSKNGR